MDCLNKLRSLPALALALVTLVGCETVDGLKRDIGIEDNKAPEFSFASEPDIRIRIARDRNEVAVAATGDLFVRTAGSSQAELVKGPLAIRCGSQGFAVTDGLNRRKNFGVGVNIEIFSGSEPGTDNAISALTSESLTIDGKKYPGFVVLFGQWDRATARFDVVVDMPVESYLPGVLSHELFGSWPRQTFEAQAVASRTYALHERDRARAASRKFDLEASDADQVFGGQTKNMRAEDAVRATRGQVLIHQGKLIRAYFSSQCGGRPASAQRAWGGVDRYDFNDIRPLQGFARTTACADSPLYRWNVVRSDEDVSKRLRSYGLAIKADFASIERVRAIEAVQMNEAGRPDLYRVTDSAGRAFDISPEQLRVGCNYTVDDLPPISKETRINSGDVEVQVWADQIRFNGRGWGHGVGMCQYCAKGMAAQGMDWPAMIKTFYPGAKVVSVY